MRQTKRSKPERAEWYPLREPLYILRLRQGVDLSLQSGAPERLHPSDWQDISTFIKTLAAFRCEHCGHLHQTQRLGALTVIHLDGDKMNCRYGNLVALCRKCYDYVQGTYKVNHGWLFDDFIPVWVRKRNLYSLAIAQGIDPTASMSLT